VVRSRATLQAGSYHGRRSRKRVKEDLLQYFQLVDKTFTFFSQTPCATDYWQLFTTDLSRANTYNFIVEEASTIQTANGAKNHAEAGDRWSRNLKQTRKKSDRYYHESIAAGKGSNDEK